jgi:hypothetical protein
LRKFFFFFYKYIRGGELPRNQLKKKIKKKSNLDLRKTIYELREKTILIVFGL